MRPTRWPASSAGSSNRLRALELERAKAETELARATAAVNRASADGVRIQGTLARTEQALASRRPEIQARLVALYTAGPPAPARRLLVTADMREAAGAERLLAAVSARDRREFASFAGLRDELARQRDALATQRRELDRSRADAAGARDAAVAATTAHETLVRDVDRRRDLAAQLAGELEAARSRLQQGIEGLSAAGAGAAGLPIKPFRGALPWPVPGRVIGAFGRQASSRFGTAVPRNGIDIAATAGAPVSAIHEGRVVFADVFAGFGRLVIVEHGGGAFSLYGHLDEVAVQKGTSLERGARLGTVGRTPAGAAALYFELRVDARPVNPVEWLARRQPPEP